MSLERLTEIAQGVARAHIEPLGLTMTVSPTEKPSLEGILIEVIHQGDRYVEHLCLKGMPEAAQEEYVHCRVHGLAARLIARHYPT